MNWEPYFCFEIKRNATVPFVKITKDQKRQKIEKSQKTKRLNKRIRNRRRLEKGTKKVVIICKQTFFVSFFAFLFRMGPTERSRKNNISYQDGPFSKFLTILP